MKVAKYLLIGACLFLVFLVNSKVEAARKGGSSANEETTLENVDYLRVSGYIKDGKLIVNILYKNFETGEAIYWKKGKVRIEIEVYENIGTRLKSKKGRRIASAFETIKSHEKEVYINVPRMREQQRGLIYCEADTGFRELRARSDFWFK